MTPWITKPVPFNIGQGAAAAEAAATTWPDSFGTDANAGTSASVSINTSDQKIGVGCVQCVTGEYNILSENVQMLPTGTSDFTYSMWINFATLVGNQELLREGNPSFPGAPTYEAYNLAAGKIKTNAGILVDDTSELSVDTWYLLQSVRDGGTETSYLSTPSEFDAYSVANASPGSIRSSVDWYLGGRASNDEAFTGLFDSIVVFHRALSDTEREEIYNSNSPDTIADTFTTLESRDELKLWYSCDALSGSDLINDAIPVT